MQRSKRDRVKFLYRFLVRMGELEAARHVLRLLHANVTPLGLQPLVYGQMRRKGPGGGDAA